MTIHPDLILTLAMLVPLAAGLVFFVVVMCVEPRSLWSGAAFLAMTGGLGMTILLLLFRYSSQIMAHPLVYNILVLVLMGVIFLLLLFPFLLAGFLMVEGVRLIRREGFSWSNCLSLGLGIFILADLLLLPAGLHEMTGVWGMVFMLVNLVITFFSMELGVFLLSALVNRIHVRQTGFDQIVVLGSGLLGDKVTPLLAGRIERGIALQKKNPDALLILSGGQGPGETVSEGEAMQKWALAHGADPARTAAETASRNTEENLAFSRQLFPCPRGKTALVTTGYHVFRALVFSREQYMPAKGFGSRTKWYFSLNAVLREYAAFVVHTRVRQLLWLGVFTFPAWFGLLAEIFAH